MLGVTGAGHKDPPQIFMQGQSVFKFAVTAVPWCIDEVLKRNGKTVDDVDFFVFHQANTRIIDLAVKKYHIPEEKYYKNISKYGNTSAASIPMAAGRIAIDSGFRGMCSCPVTACAGGTNAAGDAFHYIRDGYADVMLCGGSESSVTPLAIGGFTTMDSFEQLNSLLPAGFPVVLVDRVFSEKKFSSVCVSNFQPIYRSVCRLVGKGDRRIGIIGGLPRLSTTKERISAYQQAISDCGLAPEETFIRYGDSMMVRR